MRKKNSHKNRTIFMPNIMRTHLHNIRMINFSSDFRMTSHDFHVKRKSHENHASHFSLLYIVNTDGENI